MKKTLKKIFAQYPSVEAKFNGENIPLTNIENVFYQLALFASEPETYSFNIDLFYKYLQDEDLVFGLQILIEFFQKDTFLIKNKRNYFINTGDLENEELYNQTTFAKYLAKKGLNYTPTKLGVYYRREKEKKRGNFPLEDMLINGTPYWYESTVDLYARELLKDDKNKKTNTTSKAKTKKSEKDKENN